MSAHGFQAERVSGRGVRVLCGCMLQYIQQETAPIEITRYILPDQFQKNKRWRYWGSSEGLYCLDDGAKYRKSFGVLGGDDEERAIFGVE